MKAVCATKIKLTEELWRSMIMHRSRYLEEQTVSNRDPRFKTNRWLQSNSVFYCSRINQTSTRNFSGVGGPTAWRQLNPIHKKGNVKLKVLFIFLRWRVYQHLEQYDFCLIPIAFWDLCRRKGTTDSGRYYILALWRKETNDLTNEQKKFSHVFTGL